MNYPEKLSLARLPSPIMKLERLSERIDKNLWVWRDDLTGFVESGNKIRKLEFLLAEAIRQRASFLVTCGGPQSNHARATVCLARRLGLTVRVLIREPKEGLDQQASPNDNYLIDHIFGAEMKLIPFADYQAHGASYASFLADEIEELKHTGERPYAIPEGGSCPLGTFGYIAAVKEMLPIWQQQGPGTKAPDNLFCALGSGGTLAGLVLGYMEQGLPYETIHAINVCDSAAYFQERVGLLLQETSEQFHLQHPAGNLSIMDGHFGRGYALAEDSDLQFYAKLAQEEGLASSMYYWNWS
ncbi:MAG: pyridoxal-phosphate dependent enzyme [Oligoflexus sp.]